MVGEPRNLEFRSRKIPLPERAPRTTFIRLRNGIVVQATLRLSLLLLPFFCEASSTARDVLSFVTSVEV